MIASNLGVTAYAEGRWREASDYYMHSHDELERLGDATLAAFASANLGEVLISRGLLDQAETVLADARTTLRAAEHLTGSIFAETQLARLALVRGSAESAAEDLTRLVDEAVSIGSTSYGLEAAVYLAEAHARGGDAARALEVLEEAERTFGLDSSPLVSHLARVRSTALRHTNDLDGAREQLDLALTIARRQRLLYEEEQTLRESAVLSSILGREDEARQALGEADRLAQRLNAMS